MKYYYFGIFNIFVVYKYVVIKYLLCDLCSIDLISI